MGCDYYTYLVSVIQFKNAEGKLVEHHVTGELERNTSEYIPAEEIDPAAPDWSEKADKQMEEEREYMKRAIRSEADEYGERVLFTKGEWRCVPKEKDRILTVCTAQAIPEEQIVRVYQFKSGRINW